MKKILCMIMAVIMVMSLVACGNKTVDPTEPDNTPIVNPTDNGENTGDATTDTPNNGDDSTPVTQPNEEVEGFTGDLSQCKTYDELPQVCKDYIKRLEEVCGCPVIMVGVGPARSQNLER